MSVDSARAKSIFLAASELPDPVQREKYLQQQCGADGWLRARVEALLRAHDAAESVEEEESGGAYQVTLDAPVRMNPGTLIAGRYKLVETIGEGGMGTVWLADQKEPVKRKVALKLIKAGMDSRAVLARFEAERQALAVMDHPHIAKVLDGGTTSQGHPFFVMELVKGIPLTEYCDQVQMAVSERLELFNQVCSAVQHAHQKGIIHRDLKPSNILVTEYDGKRICKVIDFGLAKAIHGAHALTDVSLHTAFGTVVGTPLYMAPEQLGVNALDIDTRADLYSLGVILYELLTGSTPIEKQRLKKAALDEIMRIVREEEPAIPSHRLSSSETLPNVAARRHIEPAKLTKLVRGDLDWIVMKTLEKDRNRRYETANGLSLDIQRYLAGEAVLAAPPSNIYRLGKFVRKHRAPVLAACLLALTLIGGIIGTSVGFYNARISAMAESDAKRDAQNKQADAERARGEADRERAAAELARNDAVSQKTRAEAREQEAIDAVRRFGDAVANNRELKDNPALESLRKTLLQEPLAFFQSLRTRLQSDSDTSPESLHRLAQAAFDLGTLTNEIGDKQNAMIAYEHARAIYDRLARENPKVKEFQSNLADSNNNLGNLLSATGTPAEALKAYEQALEIQKGLAGDNPTVTEFQSGLARSYYNIGFLLSNAGKPAEALSALNLGLEIQERLVRENPAVTDYQSVLADRLHILGNLLSATGKPDTALHCFERALAIQKPLASENPTMTDFHHVLANIYNNHGILLSKIGKLAEASKAYEQALEIRERLARENPTVTEFHSFLAASHINIGNLLRATGKTADASSAYQRALEIQKRLASENPKVVKYQSDVAGSHHNIGYLFSATGKFADALVSFEQAVEIYRRLANQNPTVTEYQSDIAGSYNNIGNLLSATGKPAEALAAYERALEISTRLANESPTLAEFQSDVGATLNNIALIAMNSGRLADARNSFRKALEFQQRALAINNTHPTYRQFLKNHYTGLLDVLTRITDDELDPGVKTVELDQIATALQELLHSKEYGMILFQLSDILFSAGEPEEAERYLRRGLEVRRQAVTLSEPDDKDVAWLLGLYYIDGGNLLRKNKRVTESISWYSQAAEALQRYRERWPGVDVDHQLWWACQNRGWSQVLTGNYAQAISDYDQALKYCPTAEQIGLRTMRASARLRSGAIAEAIAEMKILQAEYQGTANQAYDFACFYAVASTVVPEQQQAYGDQAIKYLEQAVAAGWKNGKHMATDIDLESLRVRDDFQKLLKTLSAQPDMSPSASRQSISIPMAVYC